MPHMPRCAAPHAPQGPGSTAFAAPVETANVDSNWLMSVLPHFMQVTSTLLLNTRRSKRALQLRHSYSYRGNAVSLRFVLCPTLMLPERLWVLKNL